MSSSASSTASWLKSAAGRFDLHKDSFGFYVHVPFCASRCGYCDFNTYTASELGAGVNRETYAQQVIAEIEAAADAFTTPPRVSTVFFGGGTPSLLPAADLGAILRAIDECFGLEPDAEVTTEANPESVDPEYLKQLRTNGFTRLSLGMQSTARHVLQILERQHTPQRALEAVTWARDAGFDHVSLDLIYGTPGETIDDFARTLRAAIDAGVDHVSAYSLIVEEGTALARRVRRGEVPRPDDDLAADRYLLADQLLSEAGFTWYEVSNWAKTDRDQCRHNLLYWQGGYWWGAGPGAHSSLPGVRWWNVKHPARYAEQLHSGALPIEGHETLTVDDQYLEEIMLRARLFAGLPVSSLQEHSVTTAHRIVSDGLVEPRAFEQGTIRLTLRGRLLADAVVRDLTG